MDMTPKELQTTLDQAATLAVTSGDMLRKAGQDAGKLTEKFDCGPAAGTLQIGLCVQSNRLQLAIWHNGAYHNIPADAAPAIRDWLNKHFPK